MLSNNVVISQKRFYPEDMSDTSIFEYVADETVLKHLTNEEIKAINVLALSNGSYNVVVIVEGEDTEGFYLTEKPFTVSVGQPLFELLDKEFKNTPRGKEIQSMDKSADAQSELMGEVLARVAEMIALGIDGDTIRFYVITKVGEAKDWPAMHKTLFVASIENALQKRKL